MQGFGLPVDLAKGLTNEPTSESCVVDQAGETTLISVESETRPLEVGGPIGFPWSPDKSIGRKSRNERKEMFANSRMSL